MFKFRTFLWSLLVLMVSLPILAQDFSSQKQTVGKYTTNGTTGSQNTESTVLRWDDGTNFDAIGLTSGGTFSVAARFTPTELGAVSTQGLMSVEVYINDVPTSARLVLYGPNTDLIAGPEVYSQAFTPVTSSWNTITLTTPYIVTGTTDLWIGYEVTHGASIYPCGVDAGPAAFNGDRIYSGGAWDRLSVLAPTLNYNWNIAATFDLVGPPCPVVPASNPTPASGTTNVNALSPGNASWTNGAGTNNVEVFFGPVGNVVSVYSGAPITTLAIPAPLQYATTYNWRVVDKNDTCSAAPVATWNFTTMQNPLLVQDTITVHPQSFDYWTGTTDGVTKTEVSIVNGQNTLDGWMKFDLTGIPAGSNITGVTFNGYVSGTNWPYWSLTPMALDPVTGTAANIYAAIQAGNTLGTAYLYSNEASTYTTGAKTYPLVEGNILSDMTAAVSNGYFAMGMASRDNSATYFITFDGWAQTNPPSLDVIYEYVVPVELTSFAATTDNKNVNLNWSTATELNNSGFQIERSSGSEYQVVGFVAGHGTTTEVQNYSYVDQNVNAGSYTYRLKQVDFDGTFEYSNAIEVDILGIKEFALGQNYPNPFNPSTKINFSLAVDSKVSLKIFDVLGQEVATLINGQLAAGSQEVSFNASSLNSGVYFYRIDADGIDGQKFSSVRKMILTK